MILKGWHQPEGAVHLVTPPGGPRPARVEVLAEFSDEAFCESERSGSSGEASFLFTLLWRGRGAAHAMSGGVG